jgi:hypothetical protein
MRFSRTGLALCAAYAVIAVPLLVAGYTRVGDPKGAWVLKAIAVEPVFSLIQVLGLAEPLTAIFGLHNFPVFFLMNLLLVYAVGWLLGCAVARLNRRPKTRAMEDKKPTPTRWQQLERVVVWVGFGLLSLVFLFLAFVFGLALLGYDPVGAIAIALFFLSPIVAFVTLALAPSTRGGPHRV